MRRSSPAHPALVIQDDRRDSKKTQAIIEHKSSHSEQLRSTLEQQVADAIARTNKTTTNGTTAKRPRIARDTRAWAAEVLSDYDVRRACARTARMLDELEGEPIRGETVARDLRVLRVVIGGKNE